MEEAKSTHAYNAGLCASVCACAQCACIKALGGWLNIVGRSNDVVFVIVNVVIFMSRVVERCC